MLNPTEQDLPDPYPIPVSDDTATTDTTGIDYSDIEPTDYEGMFDGYIGY